jgi:hypothetical protein
MRVLAAVKYCPDSIQDSILKSWTIMVEVIDSVCEGKTIEVDLPDLDSTPICIPEAYESKRKMCEPAVALTCLARLEQEVFDTRGTEDRFCV